MPGLFKALGKRAGFVDASLLIRGFGIGKHCRIREPDFSLDQKAVPACMWFLQAKIYTKLKNSTKDCARYADILEYKKLPIDWNSIMWRYMCIFVISIPLYALVGCSDETVAPSTEELEKRGAVFSAAFRRDGGWKCDMPQECLVKDASFQNENWTGYIFQGVTFDNVELLDVEVSQTSFSNCEIIGLRIKRTVGYGAQNKPFFGGRYSNCNVQNIAFIGMSGADIRGQGDEQTEEARFYGLNFGAIGTNFENLHVERIRSRERFTDVLIDPFDLGSLSLINVKTSEIELLVKELLRDVDEEIDSWIRQGLSRASPTAAGRDAIEMMRAKIDTGKIDNLLREYDYGGVVILNCFLEKPSPHDILKCDPYTKEQLRVVNNERERIKNILDDEFQQMIDTSITALVENVAGALDEPARVPGSNVEVARKIRNRLKEVLAHLVTLDLDDRQRKRFEQSIFADMENSDADRLFAELLDLHEKRAEVGGEGPIEHNGSLIQLLNEASKFEKNVRNIESAFHTEQRFTAECNLRLFDLATLEDRYQRVSFLRDEVLPEKSPKEIFECRVWFATLDTSSIPGIISDSLPDVPSFLVHQVVMRKTDELNEDPAVPVEDEVGSTSQPQDRCSSIKRAHARAENQCQAGRLASCQEIAAIQVLALREGCSFR